MRFFMAFIILLMASAVSAQESTISKQQWLTYMQEKLPAAFCEGKQYFRQCFRVAESECLRVASNATRVCLGSNQDKIPNVLVQPRDGSHWGGIVGECAGNAYEASLLEKRIDSEKCNDVKNWI